MRRTSGSWRGVKKRRPRHIPAVLILGLAAGAMTACGQSGTTSTGLPTEQKDKPAKNCIVARDVMRVAEDLVRDHQPAPAAAARFYAYVATSYDDALDGGTQAGAVATTAEVMAALYPESGGQVRERLVEVARSACTGNGDSPRADVVTRYVRRMKSDGAQSLPRVDVPKGDGLWDAAGIEPATPGAGSWLRWAVAGDFDIASPPVIGSHEDEQEMAKVRDAVVARDGVWVAKINFWGGTPGTDTPAGIWQNQLHAVLAPQLDQRKVASDRTYARVQALLAQTLADAFIECWKVKFQYWTARPSMRIPDLDVSMKDPPFPSYPSGHAAVSAAAAEVLSVLVPGNADEWRSMAQDAADSRLYAGIHFEVDTVEGTKLGEAVGRDFAAAKNVTALVQ